MSFLLNILFTLPIITESAVNPPYLVTYVGNTVRTTSEELLASWGVPGYAPDNGYNIFNLAFWLSPSFHNPSIRETDGFSWGAGGWANIKATLSASVATTLTGKSNPTDDEIRQSIMDRFHAANKKLLVSAFGATDHPIAQGEDPTTLGHLIGDLIIQYKLDGVDIDNEESDALKGTAAADWLCTLTNAIRSKLPKSQNYIISHAPQAPYFGTIYQYKYLHNKCGNNIDYYNTQFYNQGSSTYNTYQNLFVQSVGWATGSGIYEWMPNPVEPEKVVVGKCTPNGGCGSTASEITPTNIKSILQNAIANTQYPWSTGFMTWEWSGERNTNLALINAVAPLFPTTPTSPTTKAPTSPSKQPTTKTPTAPTAAPPIGVGTGKICTNDKLCINVIAVTSWWISTDLPINTGNNCQISSCTQIELRVGGDTRWSPGYVDSGNGKCGYNLYVALSGTTISVDIRITSDNNEVVLSTNVIQDTSSNQNWNLNTYFASCHSGTTTTTSTSVTTTTTTTKPPSTSTTTTTKPPSTSTTVGTTTTTTKPPSTSTTTTTKPPSTTTTNGGGGNCPNVLPFKGYYPGAWGFAFDQLTTFNIIENNGCGTNIQCSNVKVNGMSCAVHDNTACNCALSSQMSAGDNMNIAITTNKGTINGVVNVNVIAHNAIWNMPYNFNICSCGNGGGTTTTTTPMITTTTTPVTTTTTTTTNQVTTTTSTTTKPPSTSTTTTTTKPPSTTTTTTKPPSTTTTTTTEISTTTIVVNPCENGIGSSNGKCREIKLKLSWGSGQWYISIWDNFDLQLPTPCVLSQLFIKRPTTNVWTQCSLSNGAYTCGGVKFVDTGSTPNIDVKLIMQNGLQMIKNSCIKGYTANSEWLFGYINSQECEGNGAQSAQAAIGIFQFERYTAASWGVFISVLIVILIISILLITCIYKSIKKRNMTDKDVEMQGMMKTTIRTSEISPEMGATPGGITQGNIQSADESDEEGDIPTKTTAGNLLGV